MIRTAVLPISLFVCCLSFSLAQEAEEPKPKTLVEAKAEFSKADKALNAAYAKTRKVIGEYEYDELRDDQREWLEYRDRRAFDSLRFDHGIEIDAEGEAAEKAAKESPYYWMAMTYLTETRIKVLRGWRGVGDADSRTGSYIDGFGGLIEMVEKGGKLYFTINVVRGPTHHMGEIGGVADINGELARFTDAGSEEKAEDSGETWLTFIREARGLKVVGANTSYYHGARAYFGGKYFRVAELDAERQAKLVKAAEQGNFGE